MGRSSNWSHVPGSIVRNSICVEDGEIFDDGDGGPAVLLPFIPAGQDVELVIEFESCGYYDPGCWYLRNGDPGYPPEGEDERTLIEAFLVTDADKHVKLPLDIQKALFDHYLNQIEEVELSTQEEDTRW